MGVFASFWILYMVLGRVEYFNTSFLIMTRLVQNDVRGQPLLGSPKILRRCFFPERQLLAEPRVLPGSPRSKPKQSPRPQGKQANHIHKIGQLVEHGDMFLHQNWFRQSTADEQRNQGKRSIQTCSQGEEVPQFGALVQLFCFCFSMANFKRHTNGHRGFLG